MNELQKLPFLGAGIGLRSQLIEETLTNSADIEVVEIIAEGHFSKYATENNRLLERVRQSYPIIPHGIDLSIGSTTPIERWFLDEIQGVTERVGAHYYSDHFALTRDGDDLDIGHLSPLWFTKEMLENVVDRVERVQQHIGKPLVLENITVPFVFGEADYEEPEFIAEVCKRTGCGLLLDVTNVYINAFNFKHDAQARIARYPLESVVQIHLAGGVVQDEYFFDTHSSAIEGPNDGVWDLFEHTVKMTPLLKAVIIERDSDFKPDFEETVLDDLRHAKSIWQKVRTGA
jgi:uncharacterized protein